MAYSPKNRYLSPSRLSEEQVKEIVELFAQDQIILEIAKHTHLNRNTITSCIKRIRKKILFYCDQKQIYHQKFKTMIKTPNFPSNFSEISPLGLVKEGGKIYVHQIFKLDNENVYNMLNNVITKKSTIFTNEWNGFDAIVLNGKKLYRLKNYEEWGQKDNFWDWSQKRLSKFRGINKQNFYLHIKECEFRYNHRSESLYLKILEVLRHF